MIPDLVLKSKEKKERRKEMYHVEIRKISNGFTVHYNDWNASPVCPRVMYFDNLAGVLALVEKLYDGKE